MAEQAVATVVGPDTVIRGEIRCAGDLVVHGRIEGAVSCGGALRLEPGGTIEAEIRARSAVLAGRVRGDVSVVEAAELEPTCRMLGDLRAARVAIAPGAAVRGRVELGDVSDDEEIWDEAAARASAGDAAGGGTPAVAGPGQGSGVDALPATACPDAAADGAGGATPAESATPAAASDAPDPDAGPPAGTQVGAGEDEAAAAGEGKVAGAAEDEVAAAGPQVGRDAAQAAAIEGTSGAGAWSPGPGAQGAGAAQPAAGPAAQGADVDRRAGVAPDGPGGDTREKASGLPAPGSGAAEPHGRRTPPPIPASALALGVRSAVVLKG